MADDKPINGSGGNGNGNGGNGGNTGTITGNGGSNGGERPKPLNPPPAGFPGSGKGK